MQSAWPCAPSRLLNFPRVWPKLQKTMERQGGKGSSGRPDCIRCWPSSKAGASDDERLLLTFCLKSKDKCNELLFYNNRTCNKKTKSSKSIFPSFCLNFTPFLKLKFTIPKKNPNLFSYSKNEIKTTPIYSILFSF